MPTPGEVADSIWNKVNLGMEEILRGAGATLPIVIKKLLEADYLAPTQKKELLKSILAAFVPVDTLAMEADLGKLDELDFCSGVPEIVRNKIIEELVEALEDAGEYLIKERIAKEVRDKVSDELTLQIREICRILTGKSLLDLDPMTRSDIARLLGRSVTGLT